MAIKGIKLISSDEIIGDVVSENADSVTIETPMNFVVTPQGPQLIPYMMFAEQTQFTFKREHILTEPVTITDQLEQFYREKFGSGIKVPSKQIITG